MLKAIAVDDEPLALRVLDSLCKNNESLTLLKTFTSIKSAELFLLKNDFDIIFMDVQMPSINGIELVKQWPQKHKIIFTTAFPEYAIEGFNCNAIDYLLKPISQERFDQAIKKALKLKNAEDLAKLQNPHYLYIKSSFSIIKININEIVYIEGLDDYQKIHLIDGKFIVAKSTLKNLQEELLSSNFIRIHKSYIVPVEKINSIRNKNVFLGGVSLPIGSIYESTVIMAFNNMI